MTKIATDFASKLAVAFVAVAMVFAAYAPAAQAQSTEDLQQMINDLLAQVAQLQAGVGTGEGSSNAASFCPYTWTRDLSMGSTGDDVMKLQQFLNSDEDTRVAAAGSVGSAGMETSYYGPATAAAVSKFQVKYRADILAPLALVNPTGYYGAGSRDKANSLCAMPTTPTTPVDGDEDEDEDEDEEEDFELGGNANLDNFEVDDADDTDVQEGDTDVEVGMITVEFANGDAELSILDIALTSGSSDQPWDAFDTISLWVDGDMIAEVDASDEDDYLNEDEGTLRFTDLGLIAEEDEEMEIVIGASIQNNLDNDELTTWTLEADRLRFFDADGVAVTETGTILSGEAEFVIEEAGEGEELRFSLSSSNPDATDIVVDDSSTTNDVTILEYTIEAEEGDIELDRLVVRVDTGAASTTDVVNDIELVIDGQTFREESITSGGLSSGRSQLTDSTGTSVWYLFDIDGDITIDEDEEVTVEVNVDFKSKDGNYENGQTIMAQVSSDERDETVAEGADDLETTDFRGTAIGDTHSLVAEGIVVPVDSVETDSSTQGTEATTGIFEIEFEVTAVEGDFYIVNNATSSDDRTDGGIYYSVDTAVGAPDSESGVLASTADEDGDVFVVREGETETFTLTVTVDASATGQHRVVMNKIFFSEDTDGIGAGATEGTYLLTPASDYRTGYRNINEVI